MLPAGAESKNTAISAHACVQTGQPKQKRKLQGFRKKSKIIPRRKKKRKKQAGLFGGDKITDTHLGFVVLNDKLFLQF